MLRFADLMFNQSQLNKFYRYACTLCDQEQDAYDLLQSTLLKWLQKKVSVDRQEAYFYRMMHNQFIDDLRQSNRFAQESSPDEIMSIDIDTQDLESLCLSQVVLEDIWSSLKPFERELLYFWAIQGYSTEEISKLLLIPKGTIVSRLHRLRQRLLAVEQGHDDLRPQRGQR